MIDKLTTEQQSRFVEFVNKWTRIGLSTEPADRPKAEEGIKKIYVIAGLKEPRVVWCSSPLANGLTRAIVLNKKVGASVGASVRASVRDSVGDSVGDSVRASVGDSVGASVWDSVRDSVWDSGYGQHDANWLGFYDFFCVVCGLKKETEKLIGHWLQAQNAGWYLPHDNICWISERHNIVRMNSRNRLHCETGMALAYPDGWGIYALNGIKMKPEYVLTPAKDINPEMIMKETNVDQRRELIRKVGVDRLASYGKKIHKEGDYELIDMSPVLAGIQYAPHLLMKNPSVEDTWHLEGVAPECKTVEQAINWRAGNIEIQWQPYQLS